ncbi:MAG: hypothetical protein AAFX94_03590 [Myxococcota bacterium]
MTWILFLLLPLPIYAEMAEDPAPGWTESRSESRNIDCERLGVEEAHRRFPDEVPAREPRGDYVERSAMVCQPLQIERGRRSAEQEAVLTDLSRSAARWAGRARQGERADTTWLVEVYHSDPAIARKVSFAAKAALVESGAQVSDRIPVLSADDVDILIRAPVTIALPQACRRYRGSMSPTDALLGVYQLDPLSTRLEVGVCRNGEWQWR